MHRIFIGLRPPPPIRAALLAVMGGIGSARWQEDDQLHLTLRFVGEVAARQADDIAAAIAQIHVAPFAVRLNGVGRFQKQGRTDAIWAGLAPADPLAALHRKVDRAVMGAGFSPEPRAFLPHVTLARLARTAGAEQEIDAFIARHAGLASAPFAFSHLTLFESHLTRGGARYHAVARWPIAG